MSDFFAKLKRTLSNKKNSKKLLDGSSDSNSDKSLKIHKHLICDNSYTNRLILRKYLEKCNCQIDEVSNTREIVELIKKNGEYNIIWINTDMPDMTSFDVIKYLREQLNYTGKIIALTSHIDETIRQECLDAGINEVLCKPFNQQEIEICTKPFFFEKVHAKA
jgi:CheY-like chemotaxis protein